MTTMAYLRVSTGSQDVANQNLAILEYARRKKCPTDDFVELQMPSRTETRRLDREVSNHKK